MAAAAGLGKRAAGVRSRTDVEVEVEVDDSA
jgi:hypothetical protein